MTEVYLSIGSNMGNRLANLQKAIQMLNVPPKIDITAISSVYETEPVGSVKQDSFYNIAVKVATGLTAQQLLDHLHNIEQELHRRRLIHWGPRTIDLDIIDFGHQHIKTSTLTIPHPEMANRKFVLLPMREITNQNDPYYQQLDHLLNKTPDHNWLKKDIWTRGIFMDQQKIAKAVKDLLIAIGEDPEREGLAETPRRVAKMYQEVFSSLNHQPEEVVNYKVFHVDDVPEMVLVQHIPFYSMCEHHLLPFFGYANVAYVPKDKKVIGLSKIPRLLDFVTKKPGMQERVTTDLVAELQRILDPAGIAVTIAARHLCMEMRGVNKAGQFTYTDKFTGKFKTDSDLKQEFLNQTRNYHADL